MEFENFVYQIPKLLQSLGAVVISSILLKPVAVNHEKCSELQNYHFTRSHHDNMGTI